MESGRNGGSWDEKRVNALQDIILYKDWGKYKGMREELSEGDIILLHTVWGKYYPQAPREMPSITTDFIHNALDSVTGNYLNVFELGCHELHLAEFMFEYADTRKIDEWSGYDANARALANGMDRLIGSEHNINGNLIDDMYMRSAINDSEIFVAVHTIEHLTDQEIVELFRTIRKAKVSQIVIETPSLYTYDPYRAGNAHVMTLTDRQLMNLIEDNFYKLEEFCSWDGNYTWRYSICE